MRIKVMCVLAILICAYGSVANISATPGDFEVLWLVQIPRDIYFIGETVTFTCTAYASIDPTLKLPDQMATVTIRNESMVEVYQTWITTNANGSAPVQWDSGLESPVGNYTVILKDLMGTTITKSFMLLFNEEMYWKTKVDLLERELDKVYEHLNYLFASNKWLTRELDYWKEVVKWSFFIVFLTLAIGLWIFWPELAKRARSEKGLYKNISKGLATLGITSEPRIYLEHEEVAQAEVPPHKAAPRFNAQNYCPTCDPDMKNPMTLVQFEAHTKVHDMAYLRGGPLGARFRKWHQDKKKEPEKKPEEKPKPAYGTVQEYSDKWKADEKRKELRVRLKALKDLHRKKKISEEVLKAELAKIRAEKELLEGRTSKPDKLPVHKETPSSKVVSQPKPQGEKQLSGIPRNRVLKNHAPKASDALDDLVDRLTKDRVN